MTNIKLLISDLKKIYWSMTAVEQDLINAFADKDESRIDVLLQKNMDVTQNNAGGISILYMATFSSLEKFNQVIDKIKDPEDINHEDMNGDTSLHLACRVGDFKKIEVLVKHRHIELNHTNDLLQTPLIALCSQSSLKNADNKTENFLLNILDCAKLLVNAGADIDFKCSEGNTALIMAAKNKNKPLTNFLLLKGANPFFMNDVHKTAFDYDPSFLKDMVSCFKNSQQLDIYKSSLTDNELKHCETLQFNLLLNKNLSQKENYFKKNKI